MDKDYHKKYREEYKKKVKYVNVAIPMPMYQQLEKLAEIEDEKIATLIRNMTLAHIKQQTATPKAVAEELKELIFLMRNVANNINQIAHHSNRVKHLIDENSLLLEIKKMEDLVKDYTTGKLKK